jgi:hypothetical protein
MDEDSAGDKFCEEDIDQILERRTQIITLESEKGSTFSKASFASSGIRSDIDIDDPDFWKKWAKKAEIDTVEESDKVNWTVLSVTVMWVVYCLSVSLHIIYEQLFCVLCHGIEAS